MVTSGCKKTRWWQTKCKLEASKEQNKSRTDFLYLYRIYTNSLWNVALCFVYVSLWCKLWSCLLTDGSTSFLCRVCFSSTEAGSCRLLGCKLAVVTQFYFKHQNLVRSCRITHFCPCSGYESTSLSLCSFHDRPCFTSLSHRLLVFILERPAVFWAGGYLSCI